MASVTVDIASFSDGQAACQIVYDDETLAISRIQLINNSIHPCMMYIARNGSVIRSITVAPGNAVGRNLPNGVAFQRLLDEDGTWGITHGDITLGARFG